MWIRVQVVWRLPLAMTVSRRGGLGRQRFALLPDLFCQGLVHSRDPVVSAWDWPWAKNRFLLVFCRMSPSPKAVPSPLLGPFDHGRSYGVPFHITRIRMEMIIFLGWTCFVRPLMQVAGSDGMIMQTIDKQKLCFYDFLRGVFVARFSGDRRQGARCLLGISRSQISGCKSSGSGTRAAGWPPNHSVFSK